MIKKLLITGLLLFFTHMTIAHAQNWEMDKSKSDVAFKLVTEGTTMVGDFSDFSTQITLNPEDTSTAIVRAEINAASISVDDKQAESTAQGRGWLFPKEFPLITFTSTKITRIDDESFEMTGDLKVKEITKSITFPFNLKIAEDKATATASFGLERALFNLGSSGDAEPIIQIKLSIFATKK